MAKMQLIPVLLFVAVGCGEMDVDVKLIDDVDTTPPVILTSSAYDITSSSFEIRWTLDEGSQGQIEWGFNSNYGNVTPRESGYLTAHEHSISGLSPDTEYQWRILGEDAAGNALTGPANVTRTQGDSVSFTATITATNDVATELDTTTGEFTVSLDVANNTGSPITVAYTVGGTAAAVEDFDALSGTVSIANGTSSNTITVTPVDDAAVETAETVTVTLNSGTYYAVGSPNSATVTIADDDTMLAYDYDLKVDFGAIGDGVTDDRAALQNAFNAISSGGTAGDRQVLYIPSGTYKLAKSGSARVTIAGDHWEIVGDGETSVITIAADPVLNWGTIVVVEDSDNWKISNFVIDGNWENVAGTAQQGVANLLIDRCNDFKVDSVINRNSWYASIQIRDVTHGDFTNNQMINTDCAIITFGDTDYINVDDNFMDGHHWSEPIAFYRGSHNHLNIRRNTLKNKGYAHGILIGKGDAPTDIHQNILIEGNVLDKINNGIGVINGINSNIIIRDNTLYVENEGIGLVNCTNCSIDNNTVSTSWGGVPLVPQGSTWTGPDDPSSPGQDGIAVVNNNTTTVTNNIITAFGWACINVQNSTAVTQNSNTCP